MKQFAAFTALAAVLSAGSGNLSRAQDVESAVATIKVTNLMKGQILTPTVFITHNAETPPVFVPGEAASTELSSVAEQGSTFGLANKFRAETGVLDVTRLASFVRPGNSATVNVKFDADHRLVSSASMIEMTNDGFVSLVAAEVPCEGSKTYLLGGWDAGSEANTELCSQIPAPCPTPARRGSCSAATEEGFVHVHSGIHGCGGFPPEVYDWSDPAAMMTIEASEDLSPDGALAAACPDRASADSEGDAGGDSGTGTGGGG